MKLKKLTFWVIVLIAVSLCFWVAFLVVPDEPGVRTLGFFLYFYVCAEIAAQIVISRKKEKEDRLLSEQKNQTAK